MRSRNQLTGRWQEWESDLPAQVFARLLAGSGVDDLLGSHDGRVDVRGVSAPTPEVVAQTEVAGMGVRKLKGLLEFRDVTLSDLDLSAAKLDHLRFFGATLRNCRFHRASCRDWRLWRTDVEACSFEGADLRDAALGTWEKGRGNTFRGVIFRGADLRGISCQAAVFVDCDFSDAKLDGVDFGGSHFVRCVFGGPLRDVMFHRTSSLAKGLGPNPMEDVDLSKAELQYVSFSDLDLDRVQFPGDDRHVVVKNYPCVMRRVIDQLGDAVDAHGIYLHLRFSQEWERSGKRRQVGVWYRPGLGDDEAQRRRAEELLLDAERACAE
ncbi:MAG TPA: pentapeptide repeat-containing protein [Pseudonocardiaceae bacterium]|jgi:uncharacterized protein YjbI with pentapeptide repeats|nr:pentapeptide repeat-containing protein [Pseudonocardiaceae bacterium]